MRNNGLSNEKKGTWWHDFSVQFVAQFFAIVILTALGIIFFDKFNQRWTEKQQLIERQSAYWKDELVQTRELVDDVYKIQNELYFYAMRLLNVNYPEALQDKYFESFVSLINKWYGCATAYRDNAIILLGEDAAYLIVDKSDNMEQNDSLYNVINECEKLIIMKRYRPSDYANVSSSQRKAVVDRFSDIGHNVFYALSEAYEQKYAAYNTKFIADK